MINHDKAATEQNLQALSGNPEGHVSRLHILFSIKAVQYGIGSDGVWK